MDNHCGLVGSRITPAHAGKTFVTSFLLLAITDHPRACGEKNRLQRDISSYRGSPPRVRGKGTRQRGEPLGGRITPACAGKTDAISDYSVSLSDHPRVCGENCIVHCPRACDCGSPPRVRGKLQVFGRLYLAHRITPACAGKTSSSSRFFSASTDHPRVCGENFNFLTCTGAFYGSPPRVRGKLEAFPDFTSTPRITPACAGKTGSNYVLL